MSKDCGNIHSDFLLFAVCHVTGVPFKDPLNSSQQAALHTWDNNIQPSIHMMNGRKMIKIFQGV